MATSRYDVVLVRHPNSYYIVIERGASTTFKISGTAPTYFNDLVIGLDRYAEYDLIKHLPCEVIFNYFINQPN